MVADGVEVGAAGDEGDVLAGFDEAGADEAADAAGAHDQDVHGGFICFGWLGAHCGLWVGEIVIHGLRQGRARVGSGATVRVVRGALTERLLTLSPPGEGFEGRLPRKFAGSP